MRVKLFISLIFQRKHKKTNSIYTIINERKVIVGLRGPFNEKR